MQIVSMSGITEIDDILKASFDNINRYEIDELCAKISSLIKDALPRKQKPLIIALYGPPGAGKSIFWDRIREHLFKNGGIFIRNKSISSEKLDRITETWVGQAQGVEENITLFLLNHSQLYGSPDFEDTKRKIAEYKSDSNLSALGDIIIISNYNDHFLERDNPDLIIEVDFCRFKSRSKNPLVRERKNIIIEARKSSGFTI